MTVNSTAIWRVRPSGSNTNGGGYDPGISGAATDYSQQNGAAFSQSSTANTSTATTVLTDTGASFTSALIGNGIWVSGTGITTTFTFITAVPSGTTLTLQTSPGTTGTSVSYNIGGAWADPWTNLSGPLVAGNLVFVLGSGTPNPASYTYDYTSSTNHTPNSGNNTAGYITIANDPATPGYLAPPNTTGGMPVIKTAGLLFYQAAFVKFSGLYFVASAATNNVHGVLEPNSVPCSAFGCVLDQFAFDIGLFGQLAANSLAIGCEVFSSIAPGSAGAHNAYNFESQGGGQVIGCNTHDTVGPGVALGDNAKILNSIVAKCNGTGVSLGGGGSNLDFQVIGCTIDGNTGSGIALDTQATLSNAKILNNICSNHTVGGTYGITVGAGTAAANSLVQAFVDYNVFYNNTTNYNAINAGSHDTALGVTPYVGSATENYSLV